MSRAVHFLFLDFYISSTQQQVDGHHMHHNAGDNEEGAEEEDCSAEFQPIVQLNEVETETGEESETILVDL